MEDKDQWVGVAPCVRAGIRSLLRRFEDQQAALDEAAKSQAALLNAHARSEARCEALEAQIVAARREAAEARRIAAESSANVASLAADLAKRPARDEVEARASEAFAAATKDAHAAIAAAEDRFAQRSDDDARKLVALVTSRDRATREETRQAISKAQETARSRGAAQAAAELKGKSLDGRFKAEALAREEEKRRLERRCDVLSREADALHKAYELLRDVGPASLFRVAAMARSATTGLPHRKSARTCARAASSPSRRRTTLWTRPRPSCRDWRTTARQATRRAVGAGLARNIATLVDARAAAVSDVKVARVASALRTEAAETSQRISESAHEERTKRDDAHNALSDEVRRVEERCSAAVDAARNDAETALAAATLKYQSDAEQRAAAATKATTHAVRKCAPRPSRRPTTRARRRSASSSRR